MNKLIEKEVNDTIKEIFTKKEFYPKHYVWVEDGVKYSAWEIAPGTMTGDGGMEMLHKMIKEEAEAFLKRNEK